MFKHSRSALLAFLLVVVYIPFLAFATEVYFSPNGGAQKRIIELIDGAKKNVDVAMYGFTSPEIADALIKALGRGVQIRIVLDRTQAAGKASQSGYLQEHVGVRIAHQKGIMHNKIGLIDGTYLITGSYNWTKSAEDNNAENCLIITTKDSPDTIKQYQKRFEQIWMLNGD